MTAVAGLCSVTFRQLPPAQILELASSCGLGAIEWGGDVHVPPGDIAAAQTIASQSADLGITCASYGSYLGVTGPAGDPGPVVATAVALGAPNLRMWCPYGSTADRSAVVAGISGVAAAAGDGGLTVSLEFHPGTLTETAASTLSLLADVAAPNLFTYWQPAPGAERDVLLGELGAVRDDVSHLHVFWWEADGTRLPLVEGESMWPSALSALDGSSCRWNAERFAFLEFVAGDDPDQLCDDARTLRGWLQTP